MGLTECFGRRRQRSAGIDICQLRDRQGVEQLDVTQTAPAAFDIGLGAVGDLAAALPPLLGVSDEFVET